MRFLTNKYALVLTLVLLLQAGGFYVIVSRPERVPNAGPLSLLPPMLGGWLMTREVPIDPEVQGVLRADDTLDRVYLNSSQTDAAYLFLAFFKTQRSGQVPHSPKNCLPGAGWEPVETGTQSIDIPGRQPVVANRYVVQHGDEKSVVLYWYQSHNRAIASEYSAKFWLVVDAVRYRRSDTALVKVTVPVRDNNVAAATRTGVEFIQALFPHLLRRLPSDSAV
jgi:EpsI family protein